MSDRFVIRIVEPAGWLAENDKPIEYRSLDVAVTATDILLHDGFLQRGNFAIVLKDANHERN